MGEEKLPVMPVFTGRLYGSGRFGQLDGVERGIYLLMLVEQWRSEGRGLPADERRLCRILALDWEEWQVVRGRVLEFFEFVDGGNRIANATLSAIWEETQGKRKARSKAGKKGAAAKWSDGKPDAVAMPVAMPVASAKPPKSDGKNMAIRNPLSVIRNPESDDPSSGARDARATDPVEDRSPAEPEPGSWGELYEALTSHPWKFGDAKARRVLELGLTAERLAEWERYAEREGRPAAVSAIQRYATPAEIPPDPAAQAKPRDSVGERRAAGRGEW